MSVMDWFRRLFVSGTVMPNVERDGESGLVALEDAEAAQGVEEEFEAPSDPAP